MTRLFVDEQEIPFPILATTSLEQVVSHVENTHLPAASVIKQIHLDGQPLVSDGFMNDPSRLAQAIENRDRIDVFTGTVGEIARDSIREAVCYLDRIEAVTPSLAASFHLSPGPEAFSNLKQFYEGFYWLTILLGRLETTFHIRMANIVVGGIPVEEHNRKFVIILRQIVEAMEREDCVLIADLLEYEILPLVPNWKDMFNVLAAEVDSAN